MPVGLPGQETFRGGDTLTRVTGSVDEVSVSEKYCMGAEEEQI